VEIVLVVVVAVVVLGAVLAGVALSRSRRGGDAAAPAPASAPPRPPQTAAPATTERAAPAPVIPAAPGLADRVRGLFGSGEATEQTWRGLEDALVRADVGPRAAAGLVARVRRHYRPAMDPTDVVATEVAAAFDGDPAWAPPDGRPGVIMVVGVNGAGKTTTIGKLAALLRDQGMTVSLSASDTYRAAAGEQLGVWAERTGAHMVAQDRGADPGAVAYDAVRAAQARATDVLIVDTAGRLHTKQPLMEELAKVKRVLEKAAGRVDQVLLVLDATTGQNGIAQARAFTDAVGVTGVVLAKMDGTARGGIVLAVREELGVPVALVGIGEGAGDLVAFEPGSFARALVA
jgi:fused signal recognition particle receptor